MLKSLLWLAGSLCLGWLSWRFAAWHTFAQDALAWFTLLWVFAGLFLLSRQRRGNGRARVTLSDAQLGALAARLRAEYAARHGEPMAAETERVAPDYFERMARMLD